MKIPSDPQARALAYIADAEASGKTLYWHKDQPSYRGRAALALETMDREANTSRYTTFGVGEVKVPSLEACVRAGWVSTLHERFFASGARGVGRAADGTTTLRQLDLTDDGVLALGVWRERKLNAPPPPLPMMSDRQRTVVELAQQARELGYALCALEPTRQEARRLRRDGWVTSCWVANNASGLVPTPMAVVELRPDIADEADLDTRRFFGS